MPGMLSQIEKRLEEKKAAKTAPKKPWTGELPSGYKPPAKLTGIRVRGQAPMLVQKKKTPTAAPVPPPLPTKKTALNDAGLKKGAAAKKALTAAKAVEAPDHGPESSEDPKLFGVGGVPAPRVPLRPPVVSLPDEDLVEPPKKKKRVWKAKPLPAGTKTIGAKIPPDFYPDLVRFRREMKHESLAKALVAAARRGIAGWEP